MNGSLKSIKIQSSHNEGDTVSVFLGEVVLDDLTGTKAEIIALDNNAVYLDNDYLNGVRYPWEVTKLNVFERNDGK